MKLEISVTEAKELINGLNNSETFLKTVRYDVQEAVGEYFSKLMNAELTEYLGREKYQRSEGSNNYRNGNYDRSFTLKGIGTVDVKVPRDRQGSFQTNVIPRSKRYQSEIADDLSLMFLTGISTRTLSMISQRLVGRKISHRSVSNANKELSEAVEKWRMRSLSEEKIKYIFVDGVNFKMRVDRSVTTVPILAAIGVLENGHKLVLGLQSGDKESASNWREFFKDLKNRGLDANSVRLGIMDGLAGLEKVFIEEFPKSKVQRCQVHVARNVICKAPRKIKTAVAED